MFGRFIWGLLIGGVTGFLFKPQIQRMMDVIRELIRKNSGSDDSE